MPSLAEAVEIENFSLKSSVITVSLFKPFMQSSNAHVPDRRENICWCRRISAADDGLELAEANDLNPDYSCRAGICGTCMCKILEGEVEYQEEPTAAIAEGSVLICISKPKTSRVVLEL
jgi:hypothetical protein